MSVEEMALRLIGFQTGIRGSRSFDIQSLHRPMSPNAHKLALIVLEMPKFALPRLQKAQFSSKDVATSTVGKNPTVPKLGESCHRDQ